MRQSGAAPALGDNMHHHQGNTDMAALLYSGDSSVEPLKAGQIDANGNFAVIDQAANQTKEEAKKVVDEGGGQTAELYQIEDYRKGTGKDVKKVVNPLENPTTDREKKCAAILESYPQAAKELEMYWEEMDLVEARKKIIFEQFKKMNARRVTEGKAKMNLKRFLELNKLGQFLVTSKGGEKESPEGFQFQTANKVYERAAVDYVGITSDPTEGFSRREIMNVNALVNFINFTLVEKKNMNSISIEYLIDAISMLRGEKILEAEDITPDRIERVGAKNQEGLLRDIFSMLWMDSDTVVVNGSQNTLDHSDRIPPVDKDASKMKVINSVMGKPASGEKLLKGNLVLSIGRLDPLVGMKGEVVKEIWIGGGRKPGEVIKEFLDCFPDATTAFKKAVKAKEFDVSKLVHVTFKPEHVGAT